MEKVAWSIIDSEIKNLQCVEFKFDKSSWFSKTKIIDSSFHKAHFNFNFTDIIFENCDFFHVYKYKFPPFLEGILNKKLFFRTFGGLFQSYHSHDGFCAFSH